MAIHTTKKVHSKIIIKALSNVTKSIQTCWKMFLWIVVVLFFFLWGVLGFFRSQKLVILRIKLDPSNENVITLFKLSTRITNETIEIILSNKIPIVEVFTA